MSESSKPDGGGWTAARIIGLILGLASLGGFGFCSLCGLFMGATTGGDLLGVTVMFAIPGLLLAWGGFVLARSMIRAAQPKSDDTTPPAP